MDARRGREQTVIQSAQDLSQSAARDVHGVVAGQQRGDLQRPEYTMTPPRHQRRCSIDQPGSTSNGSWAVSWWSTAPLPYWCPIVATVYRVRELLGRATVVPWGVEHRNGQANVHHRRGCGRNPMPGPVESWFSAMLTFSGSTGLPAPRRARVALQLRGRRAGAKSVLQAL